MRGEIRVVDDVHTAFAALVAAASPASIALSGGGTARRAYEALADAELAWNTIDVWYGDERWLPIDDPESNVGMTRAVLRDRAHPRAIHSMRTAGATSEASLVHNRAIRFAAIQAAFIPTTANASPFGLGGCRHEPRS